MRILYNSKDLKFKSPFGCVKTGEECIINIHIPKITNVFDACVTVTDKCDYNQDFPLRKSSEYDSYNVYTGTVCLDNPGLYFYYFRINAEGSAFSLYKYGYSDTNMEDGDLWQITCYDKDYDTPESFKGKVMYQIFPDRFNKSGECDLSEKLQPFTIHKDIHENPLFLPDPSGKVWNNDFFGGNLKGIIEKLPYLKELGVGIIYLNPIFKAFSNHRYDTADYKTIDPMLGTEEDFKELCNEAHRFDIKIILDGVFSHTGNNSVYFQSAISDYNSPYRQWYNFIEYPNKYHSWWGIKTLPELNELNPDYLRYIIDANDSVIAKWLKLGADCYRLDVADELPDEFIKRLHNRVKEIKKDSLVIGEVWEDASNKESYGVVRKYFSDCELDSVMNYPYKNAIVAFLREEINALSVSRTIMTIAENYPKPVLDCVMNILSTHDTIRILSILGNDDIMGTKEQKENRYVTLNMYDKALGRLFKAAFIEFVLPGIPCIYYGDEIGMEGFDDPFCRRYFTWDAINKDILDFYKILGKLKNENKCLQVGTVNSYSYDENTLVIERKYEKKVLTAIISRYSDVSYFNKSARVLLCGNGFALLENEELLKD